MGKPVKVDKFSSDNNSCDIDEYPESCKIMCKKEMITMTTTDDYYR